MRRYSHNAVERRRRDNINESIQELSHIVPATMLGTAAPQTHSPPPQASPVGGNTVPAAKPNKGVVLRKSIEYIGMLRSELDRRNERVRVLGIPS
ncbi:helix-loop-helix DNA-binding domain-domain-containing protein [Protomyces lactucae-debilis]|uniref:Helix-loop-helix DNA-binding domain-domain-containing protein n=1 Tax=Protomyces lactucae-debilis TaxID=2754530 RepID=A0A1Y2F2L0_PROLT|nr:helix-loop-helix DNA-binding domain-containing protein [Protomyces lactucae-debilis]ORY78111.1 helix-loop-helix DNA-binding domain-domain-containing protein [Protomyces lactucae-debilis]